MVREVTYSMLMIWCILLIMHCGKDHIPKKMWSTKKNKPYFSSVSMMQELWEIQIFHAYHVWKQHVGFGVWKNEKIPQCKHLWIQKQLRVWGLSITQHTHTHSHCECVNLHSLLTDKPWQNYWYLAYHAVSVDFILIINIVWGGIWVKCHFCSIEVLAVTHSPPHILTEGGHQYWGCQHQHKLIGTIIWHIQ